MALVESPGKQQQRLRFGHGRDEFERPVAFLYTCAAPRRMAVKPVAEFHRTLTHWLVSSGLKVVSISPMANARIREAVFSSWDINEPKDTEVNLRLLKKGVVLRHYDSPDNDIRHPQELTKTFQQTIGTRARRQEFIMPYTPEQNGMIERFFRSL